MVIIGRLLVIEFDGLSTSAFDEVMEVLKRYPDFEHLRLNNNESVLSLPGLEIYPDRRKAYRNYREIELTIKEFDILCLLTSNIECVLTYEQIYKKLWDEDTICNVNNTVGCHIRSLRRKLNKALPNAAFAIRCIRDIGYCLEIKSYNLV